MKCNNRYCRKEASPNQGWCPKCHAKRQVEQTEQRRASEQMRISVEQMRCQVDWMYRKNLIPDGAG
jgi:DNA-directed RNA polymerase subunit M/transcription elongation factor TFIIS